MSKFKKKANNDRANTVLESIFKTFTPSFFAIIIYSVLIFFLAEFTNRFFGQTIVHTKILEVINYLGLDSIFDKTINSVPSDVATSLNPDKITENLSLLKAWVWLIPFAVFSFITGIVHLGIFRDKQVFITFFKVCFLIALFKLIEFSLPYGAYSVFFYFIDFLKKFYLETSFIFVTCYIFLYIGAEISIFKRKNNATMDIMEDY